MYYLLLLKYSRQMKIKIGKKYGTLTWNNY